MQLDDRIRRKWVHNAEIALPEGGKLEVTASRAKLRGEGSVQKQLMKRGYRKSVHVGNVFVLSI